MKKLDLAKLPTPTCSCLVCKRMCRRPCWPTPKEAEALIQAGFADRLMLDYHRDLKGPILSPAYVGREGKEGLFPMLIDNPRCTFLDQNGLCMLHDKGLKPLEGRIATCREQDRTYLPRELHLAVGKTWQVPAAHAIIQEWSILHPQHHP